MLKQQDVWKVYVYLAFMFILYSVTAYSANCIDNSGVYSYLLYIAQEEAEIAGIPGYKSGMLVDKGNKVNKVQLLQAYKRAHMQAQLTEAQIEQINLLEKSKDDFLRDNLCKR